MRETAGRAGESLSFYPTQKSVCLSEVPLDLLDRLERRRGSWGLGFTKASFVAEGGAPLWYVEIDSQIAHALARIQQSLENAEQRRDWHRITPFIDKVGAFPNGTVYQFEWEREWRVPRRLEFSPGCPAFLFAPASEHAQLVRELTTSGIDATIYGIPPVLDPRWNGTQLQAALTKHDL